MALAEDLRLDPGPEPRDLHKWLLADGVTIHAKAPRSTCFGADLLVQAPARFCQIRLQH
jgi:hypothetical protein